MSQINRIRKENNFVLMDNGFLRNPNLSAKAKGVLAYMLSLPDDWVLYKSELTKHFTDGKDSLKKALAELEANGYLTQDKNARTETGKMTHHNITVYEVPIHCGKTAAVKPPRENRDGKPATTNIDLTKTDKLITTTTTAAEKSAAFEHYQNNIASALPETIVKKITDDLNEFGLDLLIYAMDEAVLNNVRRYAYVESILNSFRDDRITTVEQAEARKAQRGRKQPRQGGSPNGKDGDSKYIEDLNASYKY